MIHYPKRILIVEDNKATSRGPVLASSSEKAGQAEQFSRRRF